MCTIIFNWAAFFLLSSFPRPLHLLISYPLTHPSFLFNLFVLSLCNWQLTKTPSFPSFLFFTLSSFQVHLFSQPSKHFDIYLFLPSSRPSCCCLSPGLLNSQQPPTIYYLQLQDTRKEQLQPKTTTKKKYHQQVQQEQ